MPRPKTPEEALAFLLAGGRRTDKGCLISHLASNKKGYVPIDIKGKKWRAHRFVYIMLNGPISDDILVRHSCDVRNCIEPSHLLAGTAADNTRDMMERGRNKYTVRYKINPELLSKIIQLHTVGLSNVTIGRELGFSHEFVREHLIKLKEAFNG